MKKYWLIQIHAMMVCVAGLIAACTAEPAADRMAGRIPRLDPDYSDVVLPPNISPMNLAIREPGTRYWMRLRSRSGPPIEVSSRDGAMVIPGTPWRNLLAANAGDSLQLDVRVRDPDGRWQAFATVTNWIAAEAIDSHLVYRRLRPLFNYYADIGIYQRDIESFRETEILHGRGLDRGCLNCHSFPAQSADRMALNLRTARQDRPLVIAREGRIECVDQTFGYLAWHPPGGRLAFSVNQLSLFCHTIGEPRDVYDGRSDIGLYDLETRTVSMPDPIARPDWLETWPAWSPDGAWLYFCRATPRPIQEFRQIQYDLLRVSYQPGQNAWGQPETLLAAAAAGGSLGQPRISPDGRWVLFVRFGHGHFPIYHADSDLCLLDLQTRQWRRLDINSDQADSWHAWSSNGRWIVFSSKRRDGLFARPHFSYVDAQGRAHRPFVLPQEDPAYYDSCLQTFNVPELVRGPVPVSPRTLAEAIRDPARRIQPASQGAPPGPTVEGNVPAPAGPNAADKK
ncbi:MAG TPA: hypothetical protein P5022_08865 [Candidatus Paceibacterota bacterium]|nr:hypothetical protein [Candidatus Paceibacterota bacterium]